MDVLRPGKPAGITAWRVFLWLTLKRVELMASYDELVGFFDDGPLKRKTGFAMIEVADDIRTEDGGTSNHANRVIWAKKVVAQLKPSLGGEELDKVLWLVLAANSDLTTGAIAAASDAAVKTQVASVVDFLADGS